VLPLRGFIILGSIHSVDVELAECMVSFSTIFKMDISRRRQHVGGVCRRIPDDGTRDDLAMSEKSKWENR